MATQPRMLGQYTAHRERTPQATLFTCGLAKEKSPLAEPWSLASWLSFGKEKLSSVDALSCCCRCIASDGRRWGVSPCANDCCGRC